MRFRCYLVAVSGPWGIDCQTRVVGNWRSLRHGLFGLVIACLMTLSQSVLCPVTVRRYLREARERK